MTNRKCYAGSRTFYIQPTLDDRIGLLHPCISIGDSGILQDFIGRTPGISIENLLIDGPIDCLRDKPLCNCPALFEYNIVEGCETWQNYDYLHDGYAEPAWEHFEKWIQENNITFYAQPDYLHEIRCLNRDWYYINNKSQRI